MKNPRCVFMASAAQSISSHYDRMTRYPRITPPKRTCSCGPSYPPRRYQREQDSWQRFKRKRTAVWRSEDEGLSRRAKRENAETVKVSIGVLALMACRRESSVTGLSLLRWYSCSDLSRRPDSCCKTLNLPVVSSQTLATIPKTASAKAFSKELGIAYILLASSLKN